MKLKDEEDFTRTLHDLLVVRASLQQQLEKADRRMLIVLAADIAELDGYLTLNAPTNVVH